MKLSFNGSLVNLSWLIVVLAIIDQNSIPVSGNAVIDEFYDSFTMEHTRNGVTRPHHIAATPRSTVRVNGFCTSCRNGPARMYSAAFENTFLVGWYASEYIEGQDNGGSKWDRYGHLTTFTFTPNGGFVKESDHVFEFCDAYMGGIATSPDGSIIATICLARDIPENQLEDAIPIIEQARRNCNANAEIYSCYSPGMYNTAEDINRSYKMYLMEWTGGEVTANPDKIYWINNAGGGWRYGHWEISLNNDNTLYFVDIKVTINTHEGNRRFTIDRINDRFDKVKMEDGMDILNSGPGHAEYNRVTHNRYLDQWSLYAQTDIKQGMYWHLHYPGSQSAKLGEYDNTGSSFTRTGGPGNMISLGSCGWMAAATGPTGAASTNDASQQRIGLVHLPLYPNEYMAGSYPWNWIKPPLPETDGATERPGMLQLHNWGLGGENSGRVLLAYSPSMRTQGITDEYYVVEVNPNENGAFIGTPTRIRNGGWGENSLGAYMPGSGCVVFPFAWAGNDGPGSDYPTDGTRVGELPREMRLTAVCPSNPTVAHNLGDCWSDNKPVMDLSDMVVVDAPTGIVRPEQGMTLPPIPGLNDLYPQQIAGGMSGIDEEEEDQETTTMSSSSDGASSSASFSSSMAVAVRSSFMVSSFLFSAIANLMVF